MAVKFYKKCWKRWDFGRFCKLGVQIYAEFVDTIKGGFDEFSDIVEEFLRFPFHLWNGVFGHRRKEFSDILRVIMEKRGNCS